MTTTVAPVATRRCLACRKDRPLEAFPQVSREFLPTHMAGGDRRLTCTACLTKRKKEHAAERARERALERQEVIQADTAQGGRPTSVTLTVTVYTAPPPACPKCSTRGQCFGRTVTSAQGTVREVFCHACGFTAALEDGR